MALHHKSATLALAIALTASAGFVSPASASATTDTAWCGSVNALHTRNEHAPKTPTKYSSRRLALVSADKRGAYLYKELIVTQKIYEAAPNRELRAVYSSVYSVLSERYNSVGDQVHAVSALSPKSSGAQVTSTMKRVASTDQATAKRTLVQTYAIIKAGTTPLIKVCGTTTSKDLKGL